MKRFLSVHRKILTIGKADAVVEVKKLLSLWRSNIETKKRSQSKLAIK